MQILASGKTAENKYELREIDPTKNLSRLDVRQIATSNQFALEATQGFSYSGEEGSLSALDDNLSIIDVGNLEAYKDDLAKVIQTFVANDSRLDVDASTTANSLVLIPRTIASGTAPDGNSYAKESPLPFKWEDGLKFTFTASLSNTGAMTLQIPDLPGLSGAIDIIDELGNAIDPNKVVRGKKYELITTTISSVKKAILRSDYPATFSGHNTIINGDFNIWQRNISFSAVANQKYTADRWLYGKSGAMVHTISQSTDVPTVAQAGRKFKYSLKIDCTTAAVSIGASDYCSIQQRISGYDFLPLAQKTTTASFWVKSSKVGTYGVSLKNSGNDRSFVSTINVYTADTWERKTVTFLASPSAGTWDYTNGIGVTFHINLVGGSTYQTTAGSWQNGDFATTANQVNACDSTSNDFYLCGVQFEAGPVATPFENRTIQEELALCQRYFEKSYELETPIETTTGPGEVLYSNQGSQANYVSVGFKTAKRATPTITISNPVVAGNSVRNYSTATNLAATVTDASDNRFNLRLTASGTLSDIGFHWYASSEL